MTTAYATGTSTNSTTPVVESGLHGMKSICAHMGKSETTVLKLIRHENFPATKICGEWVSDPALIAGWRQEKIRRALEQGGGNG